MSERFSENVLGVVVKVPVHVNEASRSEFEPALLSFLFGQDRLRPELRMALQQRGVDVYALDSLSGTTPTGYCRVPGVYEFTPTDQILNVAQNYGIDLRDGGRVAIQFDYSGYGASADRVLELQVYKERVGQDEGLKYNPALLGDVARALFGDCELNPKAQDYLKQYGIDLVQFADENAQYLEGGTIPPTTRVPPEVAHVLDAHGFSTDKIGSFKVVDIGEYLPAQNEGILNDGTAYQWSKTTCC